MKWQELPSLHSQSFSDLSNDSWYCFLQIKIKIMLKNYNHCEWFNILINCYWQHTIFMPKLSNVEMLKTTWNVNNKNSIKRYSLMSYLFVHLMRFTARKKTDRMPLLCKRDASLWANCHIRFFPDSHNQAADSFTPAGQISLIIMSSSKQKTTQTFSHWIFFYPFQHFQFVVILFVTFNATLKSVFYLLF